MDPLHPISLCLPGSNPTSGGEEGDARAAAEVSSALAASTLLLRSRCHHLPGFALRDVFQSVTACHGGIH